MSQVHNTAHEVAHLSSGNERWWTDNPMTYDWHGESTAQPYSPEWFEAIDERFLRASRPYLSRHRPFDAIMPDDLRGKQVLEIGCGMGLHTAQLVDRGATVTAIDLTAPAVRATQTRMDRLGLTATVLQHNAESLPFPDNTFDLVWSWGVIHHAAQTARIAREISRVLKLDGETRVMVYHRDAFIASLVALRHLLSRSPFRGESLDKMLWRYSDGFLARHYTRDQGRDLFKAFFQCVEVAVFGQEVDVVPLPRWVRSRVAKYISSNRKIDIAARRGYFLFITASEPY